MNTVYEQIKKDDKKLQKCVRQCADQIIHWRSLVAEVGNPGQSYERVDAMCTQWSDIAFMAASRQLNI